LGAPVCKLRRRQLCTVIGHDVITRHFGKFDRVAIAGSKNCAFGEENIFPLETAHRMATLT